jgi:hypothetical protein
MFKNGYSMRININYCNFVISVDTFCHMYIFRCI